MIRTALGKGCYQVSASLRDLDAEIILVPFSRARIAHRPLISPLLPISLDICANLISKFLNFVTELTGLRLKSGCVFMKAGIL